MGLRQVILCSMYFHPEEEEVLMKGGVIIGADEVGRGSLAGPICAAACLITSVDRLKINTRDTSIIKIGDSKKLTTLQRERTYQWLKDSFIMTFCSVEVSEIDIYGIQTANSKALTKALELAIFEQSNSLAVAFIDHIKPVIPTGFACSVSSTRGDSTYISVACASIWAKVSRDAYMKNLAFEYPGYGWESNAGYGTKAHIAGIQKHGISPYHRKSFLTKMQFSSVKEA